ncbi:hypothetical protein Esi_0885_0002 [Ectocarpus siliculosus]|uniref:WSC domain-containing protein n=1 Tax=Ectocarpus siliculosus TaxID=2880 RepID=D7G8E1_ECTSI|nr:hypothetical protein Esi_0885_0002 [Ectocarpus siliculosus]|eukprot:CBJ34035.1 hypothetical protein Esi_0885_0002 [Ectocarpus siliculosus]
MTAEACSALCSRSAFFGTQYSTEVCKELCPDYQYYALHYADEVTPVIACEVQKCGAVHRGYCAPSWC